MVLIDLCVANFAMKVLCPHTSLDFSVMQRRCRVELALPLLILHNRCATFESIYDKKSGHKMKSMGKTMCVVTMGIALFYCRKMKR
jgi:hypothetical protein